MDPIPPIRPEEFQALAAFAGEAYRDSRMLENFSSENPIPQADDQFGSRSIAKGLEDAQRVYRESLQHQRQGPVPTSQPYPQVMEQVGTTVQTSQLKSDVNIQKQDFPNPYISTESVGPQQNDPRQLEFNFDVKEQQVTNDLLREISKKMSKIIKLLEVDNSEKDVILEKKHVPKN